MDRQTDRRTDRQTENTICRAAWSQLKNTLFSTHFMILHNFCFLFLNWQQVVDVSHDSQYVAKCKLKCHCIRLHRIIKQIYIDKDNLHGQWAVGAFSQNFKNLRTLLSRDRTIKICCLYRMLIIDRYSYLYSYSSTSTRTRTHVIIKYSDSDSDSHILQVLVLVLVLVNLVLAPALFGKKTVYPPLQLRRAGV